MTQALDGLPLIDLIPALSPEFDRPDHLADWCALIERAAHGKAIRAGLAVPSRHYKPHCRRRGKPGPVLGGRSRWHRDDPFGRRRLRTSSPFEYVSHRAIEDEGLETERAFAPKVWDLPALRAVRAELAEKDPTERIWWAQFQNDPITTGGDLFHGSTRYSELPFWAYRVGDGPDFAVSEGKHADYFALVAGRVYG